MSRGNTILGGMLNARKDTSRRHRLGAGHLLATAVTTFAVCLLADDLARSFLKDGFGFWLVSPVLEIGRTLHSAASSRQVVARLLAGAGILVSWFWIRLIQRDAPAAAATSAVIGGVMAGGGAANNAELAIWLGMRLHRNSSHRHLQPGRSWARFGNRPYADRRLPTVRGSSNRSSTGHRSRRCNMQPDVRALERSRRPASRLHGRSGRGAGMSQLGAQRGTCLTRLFAGWNRGINRGASTSALTGREQRMPELESSRSRRPQLREGSGKPYST